MSKELLIIKLGGAAITDKNTPFTARPEVIQSVMEEISKIDKPIILIHGAGSFAHTLAKEYKVVNGFDPTLDRSTQLLGVSKIRNSMQRLHQRILDIGESLKVLTFSVPISSTLVTTGQEDIEASFLLPFRKAVNLGFVPISYGDMSFDSEERGFIVVSGDRIIKLLAEHFSDFKVRVIFGSDVDGLYDKDPKLEDAKLIESIDLKNIEKWLDVAGESAGIDVTGGMTGKLLQINEIAPYVNRIDLINLTVKGRLTELLDEDNIRQTKFI